MKYKLLKDIPCILIYFKRNPEKIYSGMNNIFHKTKESDASVKTIHTLIYIYIYIYIYTHTYINITRIHVVTMVTYEERK